MPVAKVVQIGRSQAILLPQGFRVADIQVYIKKTPDGFLVMACDPWEIFMDGVRKLSDDFMGERRQPKLETRQQ